MKCCIVRDLLPTYIDGLTSKETNAEMEKHLEDCVECHIIYEQMSSEIPTEIRPEEKDIDFLKKWKIWLRHRYMIAAAAGILLVCAAFVLGKHHIPVPYDPESMTTEIDQMAYVPNSYGLKQWRDVDTLDSETAGAVEAGEYVTRDDLRLVLRKSVNSDGLASYGRTIRRNGEEIRVVYYCYTRTLWDNLFPDYSFPDHCVVQGVMYETDPSQNTAAEYQPKKREFYYLPIANMNRLDRMSDEELDAQREDAVLVWSGTI